MDNEIPELRPNQIGISCKTFIGFNPLKMEDDILYFTINKNNISFELYPQKPIIIIDKDAIKMILNKILQCEGDLPKLSKYFPEDVNTSDVGDLK